MRELKGNAVAIGTMSSRRNALYHNEHSLPAFNALDEVILAQEGRVADSIDWGTGLSALRRLPYRGTLWYWKKAMQEMRRRQVITWADMKLSLNASAHLPASALKTVFELMESTLHQTVSLCNTSWVGCKHTPLAVTGAMDIPHAQAFTCKAPN